MRNYYYMFWADAIQRFKKHHPKVRDRKKKSLTLISWTFTLAVFSTMLWLGYFHVYQNIFGFFGIFTTMGEDIPIILEMVVVFLLIYTLNYVLIFWRNLLFFCMAI
ncbi:MAG: hypothetical protein V4553_13440 [Bacteroidota bacterium]